MRGTKLLVVVLLVGLQAEAAAFELGLRDPDLHLSVPQVPAIDMQEQPARGSGARRVLIGHDDTFTVELELSRQPNEVSPRTCAGTVLRAIVARPGMPNRDNVYRAPLNATTFLVIYVLNEQQQHKLHAHLISAAGATHCADAHFTRLAKPGQDVDDWRTTFSGAVMSSPAR
jgi:hypothetical protein